MGEDSSGGAGGRIPVKEGICKTCGGKAKIFKDRQDSFSCYQGEHPDPASGKPCEDIEKPMVG